MKRMNKSSLFPWMRNRPVLARLFGLFVLITFPIYIIPPLIKEAWPEISRAWKEVVATTFLPWEDR